MTLFHVDDNSSFRDWRRYARYSLDDCQRTFQVNQRTVLNWESEKTKPPRAVFLCLMIFSGHLDMAGKKWIGFRFAADGCIESPEGDFIWPQEIRAIKFLYLAAKIERYEMIKRLNTHKLRDICR